LRTDPTEKITSGDVSGIHNINNWKNTKVIVYYIIRNEGELFENQEVDYRVIFKI
jgi:hypothetical protein